LNRELKIGIFAVTCISIFYLGFSFLKGTEFFKKQRRYYAVYNNIEGLEVGNPVILNGFTIGSVEEIKLMHDRNDSLLVTLAVNNSIILNDLTTAELASNGLISGKCVLLTLTSGGKVFEGGEFLKSSKQKTIADVLQEKAIPVIGNIDSVLIAFKGFLDEENKESLHHSLHSLENTMSNFETTSKVLKSTMQKNASNLDNILANFKHISDSINYLVSDLRPVVQKFSMIADTLNDLELKKLSQSATKTIQNLDEITAKINKGEGSMGKLINEDSLAIALNKAVGDLDSLLIDVKAHPSRYVHISVFGKKDK